MSQLLSIAIILFLSNYNFRRISGRFRNDSVMIICNYSRIGHTGHFGQSGHFGTFRTYPTYGTNRTFRTYHNIWP